MKPKARPTLYYVILLCCAVLSVPLWLFPAIEQPEHIIIKVEVPMSIRATQLKLIELGYERVWVPEQGDFNNVIPDGKWGDITDAAYCSYKAAEAIRLMEK